MGGFQNSDKKVEMSRLLAVVTLAVGLCKADIETVNIITNATESSNGVGIDGFIDTLKVAAATASIMQEEENNSSTTTNATDISIGSGIVGLFDTITGITKEVGGLFGQFHDGFEKISCENETETVEETNENQVVNETESHGSSFVIGLFETLKDLTNDVSKLVSGVEEELTNRRQDVVDLAEHVEDEVADLGDAIKNWVESIEPGERNSSGSINITLPDGKVIQIGNYSSYVKVTKLEDEDDDDTLVEDIPIIQ